MYLKKIKITEHEYLEGEKKSEAKHEYYKGEIFAMAGATEAHNLITTNIGRELSNQLRKKQCRVYSSDMKIKIEKEDKFAYPDVIVVCGERKFLDNTTTVILDADVIIEVLSDSTEAYDRGDKFSYYRQLHSLKEYLLVSQKIKKMELFQKKQNGFWFFTETKKEQLDLSITSINCTLNINDVYEKVFD